MKDETLSEKRRRFLDMQEHPENYTGDDIAQLLTDADIRQMAHDMAMAKRAMLSHEAAEVDVDRAWHDFERQHGGRRRSWTRVAASTIGIVLLSGVAFAAMVRLGVFRLRNTAQHEANAPRTEQVAAIDTARAVANAPCDSVDMQPMTFDNAELATVLGEMARFYQVEVNFRQEQSKHIRLYFRWDKHRPLAEQLELLNAFERINITLDDQTLNID